MCYLPKTTAASRFYMVVCIAASRRIACFNMVASRSCMICFGSIKVFHGRSCLFQGITWFSLVLALFGLNCVKAELARLPDVVFTFLR